MTDIKRILINATNLHVGGGVQVAASFIQELASLKDCFQACEIIVFASSSVNANLVATGFSNSGVFEYEVFDVYGLDALKKNISSRFNGFDLVFTIFGPLYLRNEVPNHIVGFAQPWIVYPNNEVYGKISRKQALLLRLKFMAQWLFFSRAARLVVELPHVKNGLVSGKAFPAERIDVVSNCVSSIYFDTPRWAPVAALGNAQEDVIRIGYVTRDYPHKNLGALVDVVKTLRQISKRNYQFYVTLNESEWAQRSDEFRAAVVNVGPINVAQCPSFYEAMDGVFFPSLLECFSVTPLEAMIMKRPLFASDRGFVRDCCGEHAYYFDPLDADSAARLIEEYFGETSEESRTTNVERAYQHVMGLPGSRERASAYIEIIKKQLAL